MLNFLNNRRDEVPQRVGGLKRQPNITYGVSLQTPQQFTTKHSIISHNTHLNPHLNYESTRQQKIPPAKKKQIQAQWTRKRDPNLLQDQKVINISGNEPKQHSPNIYKDNYFMELRKNKTRFRLTKGQFTSFIQNQHKNEILGPLQGHQRTLERSRQTKKSILQQSKTSLQKMKSNLSRYSSSFQRMKDSPLKQKSKLRQSRQTFYNTMKQQQTERRFRKSQDFELPKVIKKIYKTERQDKSYFNTIDTTNLLSYRY